MSCIARKMTIAINHHHHRCDTLYPTCHLISSTYGFFFSLFCEKIIFLVSPLSLSLSLPLSITHLFVRARSDSNWLWVLYCGFSTGFSSTRLVTLSLSGYDVLWFYVRKFNREKPKTRKRSLVSTDSFSFIFDVTTAAAAADALVVLTVYMYTQLHYRINWWNYCGIECVCKCMGLKKPRTILPATHEQTQAHTRWRDKCTRTHICPYFDTS